MVKPGGFYRYLGLLAGISLVLILLFVDAAARKPTPPLDKSKILIEEVAIESRPGSGLSRISGRISNQDKLSHHIDLKVLFYGPDGGVVGRAKGSIQNLQPGENRMFRLFTTTDIRGYVRYNLEFEGL